jgi:hypothetical protein
MQIWRALRDEFGQEMHGLDGRGDAFHRGGGKCASCASTSDDVIYRCQDCMYGDVICRSCMFDRHDHLPLHAIEVCLFFLSRNLVN